MRSRGRPPTITGTRRYPNRLRELRRHTGLPQRAVAAAAGISVAYYGALERGDKRINADTAARLAASLRCAAGDLLAGGGRASVPLTLAVAAAESEGRPESHDLPEPHELLHPGRLAAPEQCFAAEIVDDSADVDFERGAILFVRRRDAAADALRIGAKVLVRFLLETDAPARPATQEILYGILDRTIVGDLVLITRTRNSLVPRHIPIQTAARARAGLAERTLALQSRVAALTYLPGPDDPGEILGTVVYAMGPI